MLVNLMVKDMETQTAFGKAEEQILSDSCGHINVIYLKYSLICYFLGYCRAYLVKFSDIKKNLFAD